MRGATSKPIQRGHDVPRLARLGNGRLDETFDDPVAPVEARGRAKPRDLCWQSACSMK